MKKHFFTFFQFWECTFGNELWSHGIDGMEDGRPLVVAHKGASGVLPAHSVPAYQLAIDSGADIIECDVGVTKDKELVCLHDAYLSRTTNIETIPKFSDRKQWRKYEGVPYNDWWVVDFTLEELKEIRLIQDNELRNPAYNGQFPIPTLQEYIDVAKSANRTVGIYPELKTPPFFTENVPDFDYPAVLAGKLKKNGYTKKTDPAFVQSFYFDTLLTFSTLSDLPLIYLMRTSNTFDIDYNNPNVDWNNWPMWQNISDLCYGIGANKDFIVPKSQNSIKFESNLISTAHSYGVKVHPWTFRNENKYLLYDYESDPYLEYEKFYQLGVDGYFTDFSATCKRFLDSKKTESLDCSNNSSLLLISLFLYSTLLM